MKATSPNDFPLPNKYVDELLKIFSISPTSYRVFALSFTRRFGKAQSWRVAVKCLLLLHHLLRSLPDDNPFRAELLWLRTNRLLSLYPCNFQDLTSSASENYTSFVRSYARLLDESLDYISLETIEDRVSDHEENSPKLKMEDLGRMIEMLPQIQSLIDRVIDCWPTGAASRSFLVQTAMKHVIRDSFSWYTTFRREIVIVLENLIQLPYRSSVAAFGIYKKTAFQADELSKFYEMCKSMGYCGFYEYPNIDRIPDIQIRALGRFLNGMWQFTDQSSPSQISMQSPLSLTDDDGDKQDREFDQVVMKKDMELEPLIQWEVVDNVGWEDLLEASISTMVSRNDWLMQMDD